jgi:hypothetical protein
MKSTVLFLFWLFSFSAFSQVFPGPEVKSQLGFSHPQGFYTQGFNLVISNIPSNAVVHYTIDGKLPGLRSPVYTDSIPISYKQNAPNTISGIPTNPLDTPFPWYIWKPPTNNVNKATILRVRLFYSNQPSDENYTITYFVDSTINQRYNNLPVISLVTDSLSLFGYETGIYIPGLQYELDGSWDWWGGGNQNYTMKGDLWERPANITFFEGNGQVAFQQDIGIRIHGGGTRVYPQKSLRLYARAEYGKSKINYRFFPEKDVNEFKRIVLSNNGQDFLNGTMNDIVAVTLVRQQDIDIQDFRPAIVLINGEYWGIHNIRDRIDKYYFEYTHGIDPDEFDLLGGIGYVEEGDSTEYFELLDFINTHDLINDTSYNYVAGQIDIPSYIDYNIFKQYLAVTDWPGNNVSFWRTHSLGSKWRWILYDNNDAMLFTDLNSIELSMAAGGTQWPNPDWSTFLFRNLMRNKNFKIQYLERFEYHLQTTFLPDRVIHYIDSISDLYDLVLEEHIQRWSYPQSLDYRNYVITQMKNFALNRPAVVRLELDNLLDVNKGSKSESLKVFYSNKQIYIENPEQKPAVYRFFDISGRCLQTGKLTAGTRAAYPSPLSSGILLVKVIIDNEMQIRKLIVY